MDILTLTFTYAYPLDGNQRKAYEAEGIEYPPQAEIRDIMTRWRQLWQETNSSHNIIATMVELTKRCPEYIECFVYGAGLNAMSTPFLMPTRNRKGDVWTDEYFLQTVIHEMLHIFVTKDTKEYWNMVAVKYVAEEPMCQNHIMVYALLREVYKQCFGYDAPDFSRDNLPPGYMRAIEIVKQTGSDVLVAEYQTLVV